MSSSGESTAIKSSRLILKARSNAGYTLRTSESFVTPQGSMRLQQSLFPFAVSKGRPGAFCAKKYGMTKQPMISRHEVVADPKEQSRRFINAS